MYDELAPTSGEAASTYFEDLARARRKAILSLLCVLVPVAATAAIDNAVGSRFSQWVAIRGSGQLISSSLALAAIVGLAAEKALQMNIRPWKVDNRLLASALLGPNLFLIPKYWLLPLAEVFLMRRPPSQADHQQ